MAEQFVGRLSEFVDGTRQIVKVGKAEIGVFRHEGEFFAYSNYCLHQGGPACEGLTIANVEERLRGLPQRGTRTVHDQIMHLFAPGWAPTWGGRACVAAAALVAPCAHVGSTPIAAASEERGGWCAPAGN
jgi:Rieske Fe-S protein